MLAVALQFGDRFLDLLRAQLPEVDCTFNAVAEGGDGSGRGVLAFADGDPSGALANGIVVAGDVFPGSEGEYLRPSEWVLDWQKMNRSSRTPLSSRKAIIKYAKILLLPATHHYSRTFIYFNFSVPVNAIFKGL